MVSYIADYHGNIRAVTDIRGKGPHQQTGYYPYCLPMATSTGQEQNRYKYSGTRSFSEPFERMRENESEARRSLNFHDFEARMLFNDRAMFNRPDPKAHDYPHLSPYSYCAANPIRFIDPTGKYFVDANRAKVTYDAKSQTWSENATTVRRLPAKNRNHAMDLLNLSLTEADKNAREMRADTGQFNAISEIKKRISDDEDEIKKNQNK